MISNNQYVETYYKEEESTLSKRITQGVVDLVSMIVFFATFAGVSLGLSPKIRYYTCDMSDISFPNLPDVVPFWAVGIYGIIGPIIAIILVELFNAALFPGQNPDKIKDSRLRQFGICVFHGISLFAFGISTVLLLTEIGKRWIGRLRPHFLDVCKPKTSQLNCTTSGATGFIYNSIYTGGDFCTGDADSLVIYFHSFSFYFNSFHFPFDRSMQD